MSDPGATSHDDLMDLGSRWSYAPIGRRSVIEVNGTNFVVVDATTDPTTGLDAFTFKNPDTDELSIGFEGTEMTDVRDLRADATLLTQWDPAQYQAAEAYFDQIQADFGPVGSVCGNSLGGGLAAYVAARNPPVTAVTVNPAPVPESLAGVDAPNVHNYISDADVLHRMVVAAGLADRIIGNRQSFRGTSMDRAFITPNHIGSDRGDPVRTPYDGSMAVAFSLFHADRVVSEGDYGALVDVSVENLVAMTKSLDLQRDDLRAIVTMELVPLEEQLRRYAAEVYTREDAVVLRISEELELAYAEIRFRARKLRDAVEEVLRSPLVSFPSAPLPLRLAWTPIADRVEGAVGVLLDLLDEVDDVVIQNVVEVAWGGVEGLFTDESATFTRALADACATLQEDLDLIDEKWATFQKGAGATARAISQADQEAAAAVAARTCAPDAVLVDGVPPWPLGRVLPLEDDSATNLRQRAIDRRQKVAGKVLGGLATILAGGAVVAPYQALLMNAQLEAVELALGGAQAALRGPIRVASYSPVALVTGVSDDLDRFQQNVGALYDAFRAVSDSWQTAITKIGNALLHLPAVVLSLSGYLEQSFFSDEMIEEAYESLQKCRNLADTSKIAFGEVEHQLDGHCALAVDALGDHARDVRRDLRTVGDSFGEAIT